MTPQRDEIDWVPVTNTTDEVIPSGAVARVTGVSGGTFQLAKPDADSDPYVVVVGRHAIPAGKGGRGTFDPRAIAAYDPADGTPAVGDSLEAIRTAQITGRLRTRRAALAWARRRAEQGSGAHCEPETQPGTRGG